MSGHIDGVEEDILQLRVAIAAQNSNRILDVAWKDGIAALQQFIKLAEYLPGQRLLGVRHAVSERSTVDADADAERLLQSPDMRVVLPEQIG